MKRILSLIMLLVAAITLVACEEVEGSLEITQMPPTEFVVGYEGEVVFTFITDDANVYTVTWTTEGKYSYMLQGKGVAAEAVSAAGISITPMDFATAGIKTVVIKYNKLRADFQYEVKPAQQEVGNGTASNPFRVYNAAGLVELLENNAPVEGHLPSTEASNITYIKLEADLDFTNEPVLALPIANVSIDGSKALGGNYKLLNLRDTLLGHSYHVTLKNLDIVDAVTKAHIVGLEGYHFTIDNVNILGNSFTSEAAYFDKLFGVSSISNSNNYATVINIEGTAGGFVRRIDNKMKSVQEEKIDQLVFNTDGTPKMISVLDFESVLTISNSFNHGTIQTATSNGRIGGLVANAGTGKVIFVNSGNLGTVKLYIPLAEQAKINNEINVEPGAYSIIGNHLTYKDIKKDNGIVEANVLQTGDSQYWVTASNKANRVVMDAATRANALANKVEFVTTQAGSIVKDQDGKLTVSNIPTEVTSFRVAMYAAGSDHEKVDDENNVLTQYGSGGYINIFYKVLTTAEINTKLSTTQIIGILRKPYITSLSNETYTVDKVEGLTVTNNKVLGEYDASDRGNNRIANLLNNKVTIQVYGYNNANELVFAASTVVEVDATFPKTN